MIRASDGDIGSVVDFYFDDERWTIRYLVVDTGNWLPGRKVLISPISIRELSEAFKDTPHVALTKEQVRNSPHTDTDKPVSRQHEIQYADYFNWPYYWTGPGTWGAGAYPADLAAASATGKGEGAAALRTSQREDAGDPHLRSIKEVSGYFIEATDGELGHADDFVFDAETWEIRYVVVDTSNWWFGKKVLVSPQWIERVSYAQMKVHVSLSRVEIQNSPEYDPSLPISREYEARLYDYYKRPRYW